MLLTRFAPAKVNLALHVLGRREDGYHDLDSLVVFAGVGDWLSAEAADALSLELAGPFAAGLGQDADNLVLRAARALAEAAGITPRARIVLDKRLPIASGIGGGSADAAAALRLLRDLWALDVTDAALAGLGLRLGADVPVCLQGRPARMRGIGERVDPLPKLPDCGILLANPGVAVSTPAVFKARADGFSAPLDLGDAWPDIAALVRSLDGTRNDLQAPATALQPGIAEVLAALRAVPGCRLARMSGSGATCFALFDTPMDAARGCRDLDAPGWWVWGGALAAPDPSARALPTAPPRHIQRTTGGA